MFRRYRLIATAVGWLISVSLLHPVWGQEQASKPAANSQEQQATKPDASPSAPPESHSLGGIGAIEDNRKDQRDEEDLIAQKAMAFWACVMAVLSGLQFVVSGVTLFFLYRTFKETRKTTKAAVRSAESSEASTRAAEASVREQQENFVKTQRPYVFVFGAKHLMIDRMQVGGLEPWLEYSTANHGQTPAIIDSVRVGFVKSSSSDANRPPPADDDNPLKVAPVLGPGQALHDTKAWLPPGFEDGGVVIHLLSDARYATIDLSDDEECFFRVIVSYHGPFSRGHETSACWVYDEGTHMFIQYGGESYNYVR